MPLPQEMVGFSSVQEALAQAQNPAARAELARSLQHQLQTHGVLMMRGQELTEDELMDFSLLFGEELDTVNDSPIWNVSNLLADDGRPVGELASSELEVRTPGSRRALCSASQCAAVCGGLTQTRLTACTAPAPRTRRCVIAVAQRHDLSGVRAGSVRPLRGHSAASRERGRNTVRRHACRHGIDAAPPPVEDQRRVAAPLQLLPQRWVPARRATGGIHFARQNTTPRWFEVPCLNPQSVPR
jgi:hypothetical protein